MKIQALREQRSALAKEANALLDANPGDTWNDDHQASYDDFVAKISRLDQNIGNAQKQLDIDAAGAEAIDRVADDQGISTDEAAASVAKTKEAYGTWLKGGVSALNDEQRAVMSGNIIDPQNAQSTGVDSEGGFTVPTENAGVLLEELKAFGGMRQVADVRRTNGGHTIEWPTTDETNQLGALVAENALVAVQDMVFGTVSIGAYKYTSNSVAVPFELLQDSAINVEATVNNALVNRIGRITNQHFTVGTGAGQPNGAVTASTLGATANVAAAVGYEDLVELEHSVDPAYRQMGMTTFMFSDNTLRAIKQLTDADGRPLWVPGVAVGEPNQILGHNYVVNQDMANVATGNISVLFGDFSKYLIRDVMDITLFRMTDSAFTLRGQVGFVAFSRHDGNIIDASGNAIRHLIQP